MVILLNQLSYVRRKDNFAKPTIIYKFTSLTDFSTVILVCFLFPYNPYDLKGLYVVNDIRLILSNNFVKAEDTLFNFFSSFLICFMIDFSSSLCTVT